MSEAGNILLMLSIWSAVIPALVGVTVFVKMSTASRAICLMTIFSVVSQLSRYFTAERNVVYNAYMFLEFVLSVYYFWLLLGGKSRLRKTCILTYAFIFVTLYAMLAATKGFKIFFSELVCLSNLFVIICILTCYFIEVKPEGEDILSFHNPHFFYFFGWIIYVPVTLLMFALWGFLKRNPNSILQNLWILHSIGNIGMYVLFAKGFMLEGKLAYKKQNAFSFQEI